MSSQKLSREEIEFVLRRAAELETRKPDGARDNDALEVRDLVRLGEEAGLASDTIMRALTELRRGTSPVEEEGAIGRTLGPGRITITREVPGPITSVQRAVERFLREQLMTVRRHHGERIEWEKAQGLWPGLARSLDFAKRYAFGPVSRVETLIMPEPGGGASVTFNIDLSDVRRERLTRIFVRGAAAFGIVGLGGTALFPGFGVNDVLALFSGGAFAGGLFALERRRYEETRERVALAPERFLDLLIQRRLRAQDRQPLSVDDADVESVEEDTDLLGRP